jgi:hypothetical protein
MMALSFNHGHFSDPLRQPRDGITGELRVVGQSHARPNLSNKRERAALVNPKRTGDNLVINPSAKTSLSPLSPVSPVGFELHIGEAKRV